MDTIKVLDKGYVKYVGHMGNDESFVEAARMSTGKGFLGWYWEEDTYSDGVCRQCHTHHLIDSLPVDDNDNAQCTNCWGNYVAKLDDKDEWCGVSAPNPKLLGKEGQPRDLNLLEYLYSNRHSTPFEMGELQIEVKAPIFVFREWHRHRTQSYNEFSARYAVMPNEHYVPAPDRYQQQATANKQSSAGQINVAQAVVCRNRLQTEQKDIYGTYEDLLQYGLAKEVARINTPVSRYSKMRAKTDIRNWLAFLSLRMEMSAQWEIRQYANAVASIIKALFPKTFELFLEWDFLGSRFSRSEMNFLYNIFGTVLGDEASQKMIAERAHTWGMDQKQFKALMSKLTTRKDRLYKEVLEKL